MNTLSRILPLVLILGLAACERPAGERGGDGTPVRPAAAEDARAEVLEVNETWLRLANAGDFEGLTNLYAPDAIVVTPRGVLHGHAEIRADFEENFDPEDEGSLTSDRVEVSDSADMAYIFGTWSSDAGYAGSYLSVLGRRDGRWVWLADAWNLESEPGQ
jgi:ketosteroid isomerase-like protein